MRMITSFLAVQLLVGGLGASSTLAAGPGVISNATLTPGSYCHLRFPAIDEETLSSDRPALKDPSEGDIVDYYGSCDHAPLGEDQTASQRKKQSRQLNADYGD
jgi:hypothetical protein